MAENEIDQGVATAQSYPSVIQAAAKEDDSVDLVALIQILRRGKCVILGVSLAAFAIATAIAFILPPVYTSTVSFIPPNLSSSNSMASALAGQFSALGGGELVGGVRNPGDSYAGILQSRSIASDLVKRFDLMHAYGAKKESLAEKVLSSNTTVSVDPKSSIVTVSVTDKSAMLAHDIANGYMAALQETDGRLALSDASQRRLFFGQQLEREKDNLENAEVELKKSEERSGLIAPTGQTESEIRTIADTHAQIGLRQVQLAALRQSATERNPDVIRLESEIDDLQNQLARLQSGNGRGTNAPIPTSKVPEFQLDYVRKEREVKYHETLFDLLSRQYEAARLDEAREAPVVQVLDPASYPDSKSSPKRALLMFGGLLLGLILGSIWVLAREPLRQFRASLARSETGLA